MHIAKSGIPVTTAAKGAPLQSAAPLAEGIHDSSARNLARITDALQHKRICNVLGDTSFSLSFRSHVAIDYDHKSTFNIGPGEPIDPILLDCSRTITSMSVFLRMLPAKAEHEAESTAPKPASLAKDLILIDSPALLEPDAFDKLKAGLTLFRSAHPYAAIIAGKPADAEAALQMDVLKEAGLLDEVGPDSYETPVQLMFRGAVVLEKKLAAAIEAGAAIVSSSPDDIHEQVVIEPVQ